MKMDDGDDDGVRVCERHNKKQAKLGLVPTHCYVCLNRYCPDSYRLLCGACRPDHRDHTTKIMSLEDLGFLLDRLLKKPFKQVGLYMEESVDLMKKLQLIRDFKSKIDALSGEIEAQTFNMLQATQALIGEFALCKKKAHEVADTLLQIQDAQVLQQFMQSTIQNLSYLDYNFKTDQLEYSNSVIRQQLETRKKTSRTLRSKIEEVKQYNMKIIEVILNDDDSESEDHHDLLAMKKLYEDLKEELIKGIEEDKSKSRIYYATTENQNEINSRVRTPSEQDSPIKLFQMGKDKQTQTHEEFQKQKYQLKIKQMKLQLEAAAAAYRSLQTDTKAKNSKIIKDIDSMKNQKNNLEKDRDKIAKLYEKKMNLIEHYEKRLRDNRRKRIHRERQREETFAKLIQYFQHQKRESRQKDSRSSVKDNRFKKVPAPL